MLTFLEYLCQVLSILIASDWMISSKASILWIELMLKPLKEFISSLMKWFSSLLFLIKDCFVICMCSSSIRILTVIGAWFDVNLQSGHIWWLSCSNEEGHRKIRSKTEFESWTLLEYLVGKNSVGLEISSWKELAISKRVFLWEEWYRKFGFQKLSLILKSLVMMRILLILTLVFLRYFKADWDESEYTLIKK